MCPTLTWLNCSIDYYRRLPKPTNSTEGHDGESCADHSARISFSHVLRCEHGNRLAWRNRFTTRLRDFFIQSNTSPMLSVLMLDGIRQWFSSSEKEIALNPDDYHASVRQIILHQNRIGWSQLFMGRFSVTWAQQQRQYQLRQRGATDKEPHTSAWQVNLILVVWEQWHMLWKQRNGEVHGHDERTKAEASRRDVRRQLEEIYRNRSLYEENVQRLLHHNVTEHEQHSLGVTKNWLSINAPIFRESYRRVKKRMTTGMRSIRDYFSVQQ